MNRIITTRILLISGVFAGLISPIVVSIQVLTREGFNLAIHPLSMLSLGDLGWIQIANFIVTGFLTIAFSIGLNNVIPIKHRKLIAYLVGFYGIVLILAGVFTVDPMLGFPPGTPNRKPTSLSWHAQIHNFTFLFAFLALIITQVASGRYFLSIKQKGFAFFSFIIGFSTPILIIISQLTPTKMGYILFGTGLIIDVWIIVAALQMLKMNKDIIVTSKKL